MRKMKPEKLIHLCNKKGVKVFIESGNIVVQGGGCHNWGREC